MLCNVCPGLNTTDGNSGSFVVPRSQMRCIALSRFSGTGNPRDGGPESAVAIVYADASTTQRIGRKRVLFRSELEHGLDRVAQTIARDFGLNVRTSG